MTDPHVARLARVMVNYSLALRPGQQMCGRNESGVHWDMLCDTGDSEIRVDNDLFYRNGKIIVS